MKMYEKYLISYYYKEKETVSRRNYRFLFYEDPRTIPGKTFICDNSSAAKQIGLFNHLVYIINIIGSLASAFQTMKYRRFKAIFVILHNIVAIISFN